MSFVKITSMSFKYKGPTDYTFIWIFKRGHSLHWPMNFIHVTKYQPCLEAKKRFHILQLLAAQFSSDKTKRLIPSGHHWHASYGEDMSRLFNMKDNLTLISWSPPLLDGLNWIQNRAYSSTGSRAACGGISLDYINVLYILL